MMATALKTASWISREIKYQLKTKIGVCAPEPALRDIRA